MKKILLFITMICMFSGLNAGRSDFVNSYEESVWIAFDGHKNPKLVKPKGKEWIPEHTKTITVSSVNDANLFPTDIILDKQMIDWTHSVNFSVDIDGGYHLDIIL